jgi:hypothetical protein
MSDKKIIGSRITQPTNSYSMLGGRGETYHVDQNPTEVFTLLEAGRHAQTPLVHFTKDGEAVFISPYIKIEAILPEYAEDQLAEFHVDQHEEPIDAA